MAAPSLTRSLARDDAVNSLDEMRHGTRENTINHNHETCLRSRGKTRDTVNGTRALSCRSDRFRFWKHNTRYLIWRWDKTQLILYEKIIFCKFLSMNIVERLAIDNRSLSSSKNVILYLSVKTLVLSRSSKAFQSFSATSLCIINQIFALNSSLRLSPRALSRMKTYVGCVSCIASIANKAARCAELYFCHNACARLKLRE